MNFEFVKRELLDEVALSLSKHNFVYDGKDSIKRLIGEDTQSFYFLIYDKNSSIYIEPRWAIRIESIVEIYHQITVKNPEFFKDTVVLENSLFRLMDYIENTNEGRNRRYLIIQESDIEIVKKVIPQKFEQYILPYFNNNTSVKRVDALLNEDPREPVVHNWLYPQRAIMGLIAARLTNNPNVEKLIAIYEEETIEAESDYRKELSNLIKLFRSIN